LLLCIPAVFLYVIYAVFSNCLEAGRTAATCFSSRKLINRTILRNATFYVSLAKTGRELSPWSAYMIVSLLLRYLKEVKVTQIHKGKARTLWLGESPQKCFTKVVSDFL